MFRTFAVIGAILASTGVAHAEDQIIVTTAGKSPSVVKAELFRAAYTVCANVSDPLAIQTLDQCTQDSFNDAVQRFQDLQREAPARTIASR